MAPSRGPQPIGRDLHVTLSSHKGPVHVARYAKGTAKYILTGGQVQVNIVSSIILINNCVVGSFCTSIQC
jgi:hypothetical protein